MKLWVVFQIKETFDGSQYGCDQFDWMEFQGVFSTEEKARAACVAPNFCYWSAELDEELPIETIEAEDTVFPLAEK